ncbi:MAG TPA: anti-sigma factor [Solirubrobacteraceae bacterium]|jgi:anti-sigma-K factor RskA
MSDERRLDSELCGDAASYVLGAMPQDEHRAFVEHLKGCVVCREEVASLQVVVSSLPAAVPQLPAGADLKRRVMGVVEREAREQQAARGIGASETPRRARRLLPAGLISWRPALAGAAALAVIALLAVIAFGGGSGSSGGGTRVFHAQVTVPNASAAVRVSGGHAALSVANMPQSPSGHVYELWIKRAGQPQPTDVLFTVSNGGAATVGVPGSIEGVSEILVTAEPLGGSKAPTSTPVIVAPLTT